MSTETTEKRDVYATVTAQIIAAIEQGAGTWRMPWHTSGRFAFAPANVASKKAYRGINTLCLWAAAETKGYQSAEWGTYRQWSEIGAQVRKGEKATSIIFFKFSGGNEQQDGDDSPSRGAFMFAKSYAVFNAAQVDGYTPAVAPELTELERIAAADEFFQSIGADVSHGGSRAYYSPQFDSIHMPPFQAFTDNVSYYSTLAHEHAHWTSPGARCDRQLGKRFGDEAYAAEELIAELAAAFVCGTLGLTTEPREDHAQYLASWLKVLKADSKAIFTAASKAQQACDWLVKHAATRQEVAA